LDAAPQLLRLKDESADLVYIQALGPAIGAVLRDAERLGLLGQMHFAGSEFGMSEATIEMGGIACEGYLASKIVPWIDETEIPSTTLATDNQMRYPGKVLRDVEYMTGMLVAVVTSEAIKGAIEDVGYENLDGAAIKEALDNMQDFDVYGLASITYKADDHRGHTKLAVYQIREGTVVRVTDWREAPMFLPGS
jgi:ABC-type branched-subunit amino acid transport system substrate-binding protein